MLTSLSRRAGRPTTLADIPDAELDRLAGMGFDWVWLLGVWQTGAAGRNLARADRESRRQWRELLPDLDEADICGSCFAITGHRVHRRLGGHKALARLRERLHRRGLRLMLDFIPNHTARDHPWVEEHPDFYVQGSAGDLARAPQNYARVGNRVLAHGRDPNFPGWPDTFQLDYRNRALAQAMIDELVKAAAICDGARCDMAMLVLPEVFERTWGAPVEPFWPAAIERVRRRFPDFVFLAEVYWDLEQALQRQGFDYAYDKRFYDALRAGEARPVQERLRAAIDFQRRLARFLENHDEPRAASVFASGWHQAAATLSFLSPSMRFFHQGQLDGFGKHVPVQLCRGPAEPGDPQLREFYRRLLAVLRRPAVREGEFQIFECAPAWESNTSSAAFIAFGWQGPAVERVWIAVNYSPHRGQCRVKLPLADLPGRKWRLSDLLGSDSYEREGSELGSSGLYLDLRGWGHHVFEVLPSA